MTHPSERTASVLQASQFLLYLSEDLANAEIPSNVRLKAGSLLVHFPMAVHLNCAAIAFPQHWAPASDIGSAPSYFELVQRVKELELAAAATG